MSLERHSNTPSPEKAQFDFSNGCTLKANQDMPFLGVKKDDILKLEFNGTLLAIGPLSWEPDRLAEEIKRNIWTLEKTD
jgi:putative AlgH/UPF0301 family transcriptional regulator